MFFNKFLSTTSFQSIKVTLRNYSRSYLQSSIISTKDKLYIKKLLYQRKRLQNNATKSTPSQIYIQIIGPGTSAGCRSVLLVTNHINYLFNCGEGTQRLDTEYHTGLTKVEHIFITKPTWENLGGIPGTVLAIQNAGVPTLCLHGPNGSADIIEATENFMTLDNLSITTADVTKEFTDPIMTVSYIQIENPKPNGDPDIMNNNSSLDAINYYNFELKSNGIRSLSPPCSKKRTTIKVRSSDYMSRINSMMVFVCKIHGRKGILDFEKCFAAGLTPGPHLKKLQLGEDVILESGKIVKSRDMVTSFEPGPLFIVLECPGEDWIDAIVDNPAFKKYQLETASDVDQVARYVIHFSPENVLQNSKYKEWIQKFGLNTQHLVINENNSGCTSEAAHKMQHQLHLLHPEIFPLLGSQHNLITSSNTEDISKNIIEIMDEEIVKNQCDNSDSTAANIIPIKNEADISRTSNINEPIMHRCQTLNKFHLRPDKGLDKRRIVKKDLAKDVEKVMNIDGFSDLHANLQTYLKSKTQSLSDIAEYPKLIILGTGSSVSSEYRNKSGILLQLDEDRSIVLDCGEGTMGQLYTFFGQSKIDQVLKSIKAVYISHLHADHHLGLIGILKQRERVTDEPLFLLAPQHISLYLYFYHNRFESIVKQFRLISNELLIDQPTSDPAIAKDICNFLGISTISTCFVQHCTFAYGIAITLHDGRKICYSGDSMPCNNIVQLAKNSSLLIHEATMDDNMKKKAEMSRHSTISQAINVGIKANAQFILLTHFSQYCGKVPLLPLSKFKGRYFNHIGIAYDFMSVSLSELSLLPRFYPCLTNMFQEHRARKTKVIYY